MSKINLSELVDNMDLQSDEVTCYFDPVENTFYFDGLGLDENISSIEDRLLALPSQYEIHEYRIMEKFSHSQENNEVHDRLIKAISGRGAFRCFKDSIFDLDIEDQWYAYRDKAFKEIAVDWCEENQLEMS